MEDVPREGHDLVLPQVVTEKGWRSLG
jgi:5-formyltetrahydrofolate cyclo-ligase